MLRGEWVQGDVGKHTLLGENCFKNEGGTDCKVLDKINNYINIPKILNFVKFKHGLTLSLPSVLMCFNSEVLNVRFFQPSVCTHLHTADWMTFLNSFLSVCETVEVILDKSEH